jgi:hypothetical protein
VIEKVCHKKFSKFYEKRNCCSCKPFFARVERIFRKYFLYENENEKKQKERKRERDKETNRQIEKERKRNK